jgi:hypothetical protein
MHTWLPIVLSKLISLMQATSLRERYYTLVNRVELLEVAIEDIERINANSANPNALISGICNNIRN